MDGSVTFRTVVPADHEAARELYRRHYWRPHCLLLDEPFYDWQIRQPPLSRQRGGDQSVVAVDAQGRLLAHLALFPEVVWDHGRDRTGLHLISWLADPQVRGVGLGSAMIDHVKGLSDLLVGRSLSAPSRAAFMKQQFRYLTRCQRWLGVLHAPACLPLLIEPPEQAAKVLQRREWPRGQPRPYRTGPHPPSGAETLARQVLRGSVAFARTQEYLTWRYTHHPRLHYDFLWLGDAARPHAWAVTRTETIGGRPGKALRILEFLAPDEAAVDLAHALADWGRQQGCAFMDQFGLSERLLAGFVAAGAWNTLEEPELRLPTLLSPWDPNDAPPGILLYSRPEPGTGIALTDNVADFYLSKGDGNMDWPSWAAVAQAA